MSAYPLPPSLPRSRFLDVTQRSPKKNGCWHPNYIPFSELANHSSGSILGTFSRQTHRLRLVQSDIVFYRDPHVEKYHKQHKTYGGAWRSFRKASSKFNISELNAYQKLAIRKVFVEKEEVFVEGVDRPNTTHKLVITVWYVTL